MFVRGDVLTVERHERSHDFVILCNGERVSEVLVGFAGRSAELRVGERQCSVGRAGRGWHVGAWAPDGSLTAWYRERWIFAGHLGVQTLPHMTLRPPIVRGWVLRLPDGRKILEADRRGLGVKASLENALPAHADDELVVSFVLAVVSLRMTFGTCPLRAVDRAESRAEGVGDLLDGDDGGDGGE